MAKSFYEPKKIVRYSDNIIKNEVGLGAASTPVLRPSATKVTPKTEAIPPSAAVVSAPAPAPAPAPVVPAPTPPPPIPEALAFSFDGDTYLTGSYPAALGAKPFLTATISVTFTPYWSEESTGSFTIYSIAGNNTNSTGSGLNMYIERTSGSEGYESFVGIEIISGSNLRGSKHRLNLIPEGVFSGSVSNFNIQLKHDAGAIVEIAENGNRQNITGNKLPVGYGDTMYLGNKTARKAILSYNWYDFAVGTALLQPSGSELVRGNFSGSIDNFFIAPYTWQFFNSPITAAAYEDVQVKAAYKFEGNTDAEKGTISLDVVGTETYVSSSL